MELSAAQIARLRGLSQEQIGNLIAQSGRQLGLSEQRAKALARQSGSLHKRLQKMSDAQLQRFAAMLGEGQVNDLLSRLE